MLATDLNALVRVPSRIVLGPTDLTLPFPYGGTSLGLVRDIAVDLDQMQDELVEENVGPQPAQSLNTGQAWGLSAIVRALEQGLTGTFFTTETGSSSGEPGIYYNPVADKLGQAIATVAVLLCPLDEVQHFFTYFPAAIAKPKVAQRIAQQIAAEAGLAVAFKATPRASDGLTVRCKKKEDLVL